MHNQLYTTGIYLRFTVYRALARITCEILCWTATPVCWHLNRISCGLRTIIFFSLLNAVMHDFRLRCLRTFKMIIIIIIKHSYASLVYNLYYFVVCFTHTHIALTYISFFSYQFSSNTEWMAAVSQHAMRRHPGGPLDPSTSFVSGYYRTSCHQVNQYSYSLCFIWNGSCLPHAATTAWAYWILRIIYIYLVSLCWIWASSTAYNGINTIFYYKHRSHGK